jgi:hypothetical protein
VSLGYNANGLGFDCVTQLFNFSGNALLTMDTPGGVAGLYNAENSDNGLPPNMSMDDMILADPIQGESPLTNAADVAGKIVFIRRGATSFFTKITNAEAAGAVGVVVFNAVGSTEIFSMGSTGGTGIPAVMIGKDDGDLIAGFTGGDPLDTANYTMPTTGSTTYSGSVGGAGASGVVPLGATGDLFFALIKSSLVPAGKIYGYVRFGDMTHTDPLNIMISGEWSDDFDKGNTAQAFRKKYAAIMKQDIGGGKLFSDCDRIIIDTRTNFGGYSVDGLHFGSFFGANRPGFTNANTPAGRGHGKVEFMKETLEVAPNPTTRTEIASAENTIINVDLAEAEHGPEAIFKGSEVIFLNSTDGYSAGDFFPHAFKGPDDDPTNIGGGVTVIHMGNLDGRLAGGTSFTSWSPLNENSRFKFLPETFGDKRPIPALGATGEREETFIDLNTETDGWMANHFPKMDADVLLSGEPQTGFYTDVGLNTPYPPARTMAPYDVFVTEFGVPDNADSGTWHDRWLEEAITHVFV